MKLQIKKISIEILIILIRFLVAIKNLLAVFFIHIIYKPLKIVLKFIFYKVVVKLYCYYRSIIQKFGWNKKEGGLIYFLLNQKLVHIFVFVLTVTVVFTNLIAKSKAGTISDEIHKTILAQIISSEFETETGSQELITEYLDEKTLLSSIEANYLTDGNVLQGQPGIITENIENEEEVGMLTQGGAAIIKPELALTTRIKRLRTETIEYEIQPGDTISTIAQALEVSVNTILWENGLSAHSLIRPGNKLKILPFSGISHTIAKGENLGSIAKKYKIEENDIIEVNKIEDAGKISIGQKLLIPGGQKIVPQKTYVARSGYTGISALSNIIKPADAVPASNKMNWPTEGHRITQYYSWRHQGLDIANKTGTPIYAADAGTVELAGWNNGYGYNIVINHGGGKKTRYAHFSKLYVSAKQQVNKGEAIGAMGSTGWSTGPHLHFEVIINGTKYNPLNYIR